MFYCEPCRIKNDWPESMSGSRGPCEICGRVAVCWDRPSSTLPLPKPPSTAPAPPITYGE